MNKSDVVNKMTIVLEDNKEKYQLLFEKYKEQFYHYPILFFMKAHEALEVIATLQKPVMLTLFVDGELLPGGGSGVEFLNRMIDDWPMLIERVIVCSYSDATRKEMTEICHENLIATELLPLPFAK